MENSFTNVIELFKLRVKHLKFDMSKTVNVQARALLQNEIYTIEHVLRCFEDQEFFDFYYQNETERNK